MDIPDAKFGSSGPSSLRDIASQNFPRDKGKESSNSAIYPRKTGLTLKKKSFYVQKRSSRPTLTPHVNFSNFQAAISNFAKIWSEHVLKINTK